MNKVIKKVVTRKQALKDVLEKIEKENRKPKKH